MLKTQTEAGGATACSPVSIVCADCVLCAAPRVPTLQEMDRAMMLGCDIWQALVSSGRDARDAFMTPSSVLRRVGSMNATRQMPRWTHLCEINGLHCVGELPDDYREFVLALGSGAHVDDMDRATATPIRHVATLRECFDRFRIMCDYDCRSIAMALTYSGHTIALVGVYVGDEKDDEIVAPIYHALDSLSGLWLVARTDAQADELFDMVEKRWCRPMHEAVAEAQFFGDVFAVSTMNSR